MKFMKESSSVALADKKPQLMKEKIQERERELQLDMVVEGGVDNLGRPVI